MAEDQVEFKIVVDESGAVTSLKKIQKDTDDAGKKFDDTSKKASNLGPILKNIAQVGAAAFTGLTAFVAKSIAEYGKAERATNILNQALANQGIYSKELSSQYQKLASEMQKVSLFGDDEVVSAQATIQQYAGKITVTKELIQATVDLGQKLGSLDTAAELVGKSIGSSTNALGRYGISTDGARSASEKADKVIQGLNGQFGGLALAATKGTGGIKQMQNIVGDLQEVFGLQFMPVLRLATQEFFKLFDLFNDSPSIVQSYRDALSGVVRVAFALKEITVALGQTIGSVLARSFETVSNVIRGNFRQALDTAKGTFGDLKEIAAGTAENIKADFARVTEEFSKNEEDLAEKRQEAINQKAKKRQSEIDAELAREVEYYEQLGTIVMIGEEKLRNMSKAQKDQTIKDQQAFFSTAASLQNSKSKELALIGKAAAITQVAIQTPPAIASSFRFGSQIGGPILGGVFAGIATAAMAAQAAQIAGVKVAKGGRIETGLASMDNVPAILQRGEFVAPKESADDIINARARELAGLGGGGVTEVIISMKDEIMNFFEAKILERRANGISAI